MAVNIYTYHTGKIYKLYEQQYGVTIYNATKIKDAITAFLKSVDNLLPQDLGPILTVKVNQKLTTMKIKLMNGGDFWWYFVATKPSTAYTLDLWIIGQNPSDVQSTMIHWRQED